MPLPCQGGAPILRGMAGRALLIAVMLMACGDDDFVGVIDSGGLADGAASSDGPPGPDGGAAPDGGPSFDLTCAGDPLPTTAPAMITLAGRVIDLDAAGVAVELHRVADDELLGEATTAADGRFSFAVATGGEPID